MEPERLSLLDQMELRPDVVVKKQMLSKAKNKLFSFSEVANAMALFEGTFDKGFVAWLLEIQERS